ncbi:hypothetical protein Bca4012_013983 [Brassica carinata]|uniref:C2H2-type domain-containing protein n=1 Tax=Brassica carinata TaxID=52824 RepID=A0A8X7U2Z8_BRACI|nr:hypothetical protein Bca52824_068340 [Brassica carinata]
MSHVCKICGKRFATAQAVYGHQRVHSELKRVWGLKKPRVCSVLTSIGPNKALDPSSSLKESSSVMTETEKHEMDEAAMSLVMFSERVSVIRNLPPGDIAVHCVDQSKQEFSEVSATCSDVVAQALLPSSLRSKPLAKREGNLSYRIKICGRSFERSLGGHDQTLHRSNREKLERKKEEVEVSDSLCDVLADSGATKIVPQPSSCLEVSQEELVERGDTDVKEHSVEARHGFSKVSSHSGSKKSGSHSDVVAREALLFPPRSKLQEAPESNSSYNCKVCGKTFLRFQALGGHQTLHRSSNRGKLACEKQEFEAGHSLSVLTVSGAKKVVPEPSCFEVFHEELIKRRDANVKEGSVESRQGFSKASFDKASSYSDVVAQEALPFPPRSNFQEKPQSNSNSYKCKVCGKSFGCFQALGTHQNLHRPVSVILGLKRKRFEDKEIVPQPSSFEVSQEELTEPKDTNVKEHCVELKQDFETLSTCSDVLAQALPSPLRCNMQKGLQSNSSYERVLKML